MSSTIWKRRTFSTTCGKNSRGLVIISNEPYSLAEMDGRIKSRLLLDEIEFRPYCANEVFDLLKERVEYGMKPRSVSTELVSLVAKMCNGDARIGLQTLRLAAREAEMQDRDTITIEDVKTASKFARKYRFSYLLAKLNEHQRIIYEILKQNKIVYPDEMNCDQMCQYKVFKIFQDVKKA